MLKVMNLSEIAKLDDLLPIAGTEASQFTQHLLVAHGIFQSAAFAWLPIGRY